MWHGMADGLKSPERCVSDGDRGGYSGAVSTLVVGDVHGCAAELRALVDQVDPQRLVLVGDLYTKGPDPVGVWEVLRDRDAQAVLGNHDARLIDVIEGRRPRDSHGHAVVSALDAADPRWRDHLRALPLFLEVEGWLVVHAGVHPTQGPAGTTKGMAIAMRRFPLRGPDTQPWHAQYTGTVPIVFGHDARGGFVRIERDGAPWVVGLDTGCVYGGMLSGFVPRDDLLVQVPARRMWRAVD